MDVMILVGPLDSPFVRRVAVALNILGLPHEHSPWSAFGDVQCLATLNSLRRVPALVLDDGDDMIGIAMVLDHLDEVADGARFIAPCGPERRAMLRVCALAPGLCNKTVGVIYEQLLHDVVPEAWLARCFTQIEAALTALEAARAACPTRFWFGSTPSHADIAVTCALRFLAEALPQLDAPARRPHLAAHAAACEAMPAFAATAQPFTLPSRPIPRPAVAGAA